MTRVIFVNNKSLLLCRCVYLSACVTVVVQLLSYVLTLCDPTDCSLPGSSVHGTSQARILERVAISFSRGSSQPRAQTLVSCLAGGFFTTEPPRKSLHTDINKDRQQSRCRYIPLALFLWRTLSNIFPFTYSQRPAPSWSNILLPFMQLHIFQ